MGGGAGDAGGGLVQGSFPRGGIATKHTQPVDLQFVVCDQTTWELTKALGSCRAAVSDQTRVESSIRWGDEFRELTDWTSGRWSGRRGGGLVQGSFPRGGTATKHTQPVDFKFVVCDQTTWELTSAFGS